MRRVTRKTLSIILLFKNIALTLLYSYHVLSFFTKLCNFSQHCIVSAFQAFVLKNGEPKLISGKQEHFERILNNYFF